MCKIWQSSSKAFHKNICGVEHQAYISAFLILRDVFDEVWVELNPSLSPSFPLVSHSLFLSSLPHSFPSPHLSPFPPSLPSPLLSPSLRCSSVAPLLWSSSSPLSLANGAFEVSLNSRAPNTHSWRTGHFFCHLSVRNVLHQLWSHKHICAIKN